MNRTFRCNVGRHPPLARMALHRGEIDDCAPAALFDGRNSEMRKEIDACDVDGKAPIPCFGISFDRIAKGMDGGGVHDDIEPAEQFRYLGNRTLNLIGPRTSTRWT